MSAKRIPLGGTAYIEESDGEGRYAVKAVTVLGYDARGMVAFQRADGSTDAGWHPSNLKAKAMLPRCAHCQRRRTSKPLCGYCQQQANKKAKALARAAWTRGCRLPRRRSAACRDRCTTPRSTATERQPAAFGPPRGDRR